MLVKALEDLDRFLQKTNSSIVGVYFFQWSDCEKDIMVPQQNMDGSRSETPTNGMPRFGSQLVDKNSSTPYSDATQVGSKTLSVCPNCNVITVKMNFRQNFREFFTSFLRCWQEKISCFRNVGEPRFFLQILSRYPFDWASTYLHLK